MASVAGHPWTAPARAVVAMRLRLPVDLHAWLVEVSAAVRVHGRRDPVPGSMNALACGLLAMGLRDRNEDPAALAETIDFDAPVGETVSFNLRMSGGLHRAIVRAAAVATFWTGRRVSAHRLIVSLLAAQREAVDPDPWAFFDAVMAADREQAEPDA